LSNKTNCLGSKIYNDDAEGMECMSAQSQNGTEVNITCLFIGLVLLLITI
jgi:hypothetical protein